MIKLIITDMDGTFLNSAGDYNRTLFQEVNQKMQQAGVYFSPCTGKQVERVEELFGDISRDFWILGDSATRIKHQGEYVYQSLLPNPLGQAIIERLQSEQGEHIIIACTPDGAYLLDSTAEPLKALMRRSYTKLTEVRNYQQIDGDFVKITVFDPKGGCPELRTHLTDFDEQAYIVVSEANWIDIANQGVHKGTTVARLQEMLGVTEQETMVFGDGFNDIELLERGAFSFAMRNAFPETQAIAKYITGSNDQDAVMTTILQMLQLQEKSK